MENLIELYKYLFKRKLSILVFFSLFIFIGIAYTLNEAPRYATTMVIAENAEDKSLDSQSIVSFALGQAGTSSSKFYYQLKEVLFSMETTRKLNEDNALLKSFYKKYYSSENDTFSPIWKFSTYLQALKFRLIGIDYSPVPNEYLLNGLIKSSMTVLYDDFSDLIYIRSNTHSPARTEKLLQSLIAVSDQHYKNLEEASIQQRIEFLTREISQTSALSQREALTRILENELLKKSLINTNSSYKIKIVRDVQTSEYPVSPNVLFNLLLFSMLGLFLILAFHILNFIRKNFFQYIENSLA